MDNSTYGTERLVLVICVWYRLRGVIPIAQQSYQLPFNLSDHDIPHTDVPVKNLLLELKHFLHRYEWL